ncbi:MAG: hypothetical protein JXB38_06920 [Anaerolineales bacterium]|nr:hypothetical protein [Anaerolineales bacterium]
MMMTEEQKIWQQWAARLQNLGLDEVVATFLEVTGPLNFVGAQLVYVGQPVLRGLIPTHSLHALANILEDRQNTQDFVHYLREADA